MYSTILADPPWRYERRPPKGAGNIHKGHVSVDVAEHYPTMTIDELCRLPVNDIAHRNSHLYLWTTNSFMAEAHTIARSWRFDIKTIITWVKVKKQSSEPSMKCGYYYRSATEHILFCVKGSLKLRGKCHPTAFLHERLPHSQKPDYVYDLIEQQSPPDYCELFARRSRDGWHQWGNEIESAPTLMESLRSPQTSYD